MAKMLAKFGLSSLRTRFTEQDRCGTLVTVEAVAPFGISCQAPGILMATVPQGLQYRSSHLKADFGRTHLPHWIPCW